MSNLPLNRPRSPPKMVLLNCKYDLTKMCRSCSSSKENIKHVSLFQTVKIDNNNYVIADMLNKCTSLKIQLGDGLPIMICYQCIYDLITTYNFIKKSKETDESFRQYIFNDNSDSLNALQESNVNNIKVDLKEHHLVDINNETFIEEENNQVNDISLETELIDNNDIVRNQIIEENNSNKLNNERPIPPLVITKGIVPPNTFCIAVQDKNRKIRNIVVNKNKITHLNVEENKVKYTDGRLLKINNLNLLIKNAPNNQKKNQNIKIEVDQEKENDLARDDEDNYELPMPKDRDRNMKIRQCSYSDCKKTFTFIKGVNFNEVLQEYKGHVNSHYNDEGFWCDICPRRVTAQKFLETHNTYCHKGRSCKKCNKVFHNRVEYFEHKKTHNKPKYTCKYCKRIFKTFKAYETCEQKHKGTLEKYQCDQCEKSYVFPYELVIHKRRVHEKLNRYLCQVCGRKFFFQYELERHEGIHDAERKVYKCEICDKQVLTKYTLTKHIIAVHGKEERRFQCSLCPKKFLFRSNYNCHMRRHSRGNYKYKCQFCEKSYYSQRELKYHIQTHTGERPHKCPFCTKTYRRAQALTEHVRTHTGERPYQCDICSMTFARHTIATKHRKLCQAKANGEKKRRSSKKIQIPIEDEGILMDEMQVTELEVLNDINMDGEEIEEQEQCLEIQIDEHCEEYIEHEEEYLEYETEEIKTEIVETTEEMQIVNYEYQ